MLLSFKADVFEKVVTGEKIYEHRKVFPDEPIEAYLYVSAPIKAITGVMHLSNRVLIEDWKKTYSYDKKALIRIEQYLKQHKYAMEINDFQGTTEISLERLRRDIPGFVVPQMYYYIDNTELLKYLKNTLVPIGGLIENSFSDIPSDSICTL